MYYLDSNGAPLAEGDMVETPAGLEAQISGFYEVDGDVILELYMHEPVEQAVGFTPLLSTDVQKIGQAVYRGDEVLVRIGSAMFDAVVTNPYALDPILGRCIAAQDMAGAGSTFVISDILENYTADAEANLAPEVQASKSRRSGSISAWKSGLQLEVEASKCPICQGDVEPVGANGSRVASTEGAHAYCDSCGAEWATWNAYEAQAAADGARTAALGEYGYHATMAENVDSIMSLGLLAAKRGEYGYKIFFGGAVTRYSKMHGDMLIKFPLSAVPSGVDITSVYSEEMGWYSLNSSEPFSIAPQHLEVIPAPNISVAERTAQSEPVLKPYIDPRGGFWVKKNPRNDKPLQMYTVEVDGKFVGMVGQVAQVATNSRGRAMPNGSTYQTGWRIRWNFALGESPERCHIKTSEYADATRADALAMMMRNLERNR